MRAKLLFGWMLMAGLTGCTAWSCYPGCNRHTQNSTSLIEYLYPNDSSAPRDNAQPQLHLPLRVGLAFLPSRGPEAENGLDAAHKEALLEEIRQRFITRKFVAEIVLIPDYYLKGKGDPKLQTRHQKCCAEDNQKNSAPRPHECIIDSNAQADSNEGWEWTYECAA